MIRVVNGHVTLVLANRQLVFGIVALMALMWMFAVVTFMVSKVAFPSAVAADVEMAEPVIEVNSPSLPDELAGAEAGFKPTYLMDVQPGGIYLQVATVNDQMATTYAKYLTEKSISAFTSSGPSGENSMLMVGPVKDATQLAMLRQELQRAGFDPH